MPTNRDVFRLTFADALSAHRRALSTGGRDGIPNPGLVHSAISRPYSGYYRSVASMAAALVQSVATNHGFLDGNKRTSVILMHTFLTNSGYQLRPVGSEVIDQAVEEMVLAVVERTLSFEGLVTWFEARLDARA